MEPFKPKTPRVTLKDHKQDFNDKPTVRLINPSKTDLGKTSKNILDRILPKLKSQIRLKQWRNTDNVKNWFKAIEDKNSTNFIQLDIVSYYPSITFGLLNKSLIFAMQNSNLNKNEVDVIRAARRTVIEYNNEYWSRKDRPEEMDITIGAKDSAEITDLVGVYLLWKLGDELPDLGGGLYRDDVLLIVSKYSRVGIERLTKKIRKCFGREGLKITVEANHKTVNFLDVTLELETGNYRPFHKSNENLRYINRKSNHPKSIIKQLVKSISNRISKLSANEEIFKQNEEYYNEALRRAGYEDKIEYLDNERMRLKDDPGRERLNMGMIKDDVKNRKQRENKMGTISGKHEYKKPEPNIKKKSRKRKIVWFNPPYNSNVMSNITKNFFALLDSNFPKKHKYSSIINRHTVKLSYSTTPNLEKIIAGINGSKIRKMGGETERTTENSSITTNLNLNLII